MVWTHKDFATSMIDFDRIERFLKYRWAIVLLAGMGILLLILWIDPVVARFCFNHIREENYNPWLGTLKRFGRTLAPLWLVLVWSYFKGDRRIVVNTILALLLTGVSVGSTKLITQRVRPNFRLDQEKYAERQADGYGYLSFPSGDTASVFAIATAVAPSLPEPWRSLSFAIAGGVGIGRVARVRHYVSDVLAGALLGIFCGWIACSILRSLVDDQTLEKWIRRKVLWVLIWALPALDLLIHREDGSFADFLAGLGPWIVFALLLARGESWLRALLDSGHPENEMHRAAGNWRLKLIVMVLAGLTILPHLSWLTLYDRDEGYYAQCALEMNQRGDYVVPHYLNEPWLEKPPLTFWMMALSMRLLGANEFAARLPSALAGLGAVWLTFLLGKRLYGQRAGVFAGLILGTSILFAGTMRFALLDTSLVVTVLISMLGLWMFLHATPGGDSSAERKNGWFLFYIGCGLGILAKGPLGMALPLIALAGYLLLTRRWSLIREMKLVRGILLACLIFSLWAIPALWATRGGYFTELVWVRTLRPVFSPLQGHGGGSLPSYLLLLPAYLPIVFLGMLPWSILLIPAIRSAVRERATADDRQAFLWGWILSQLLVFSLVSTKLPHYVLPLFPALAIFLGLHLEQALLSPQATWAMAAKRYRMPLLIVTGILGILFVSIPIILGFSLAWLAFIPVAAALVLAVRYLLDLLEAEQYHRALVILIASLVMVFSLLFQVAMPALEGGKSAWRVAEFLEQEFDEDFLPEVNVGVRAYREVSLPFYLKQQVERLSTVEQMNEFLRQPRPAVIVIPTRQLERDLESGLNRNYHVLWERRVWIPERGRWINLIIIGNGLKPGDPPLPLPYQPGEQRFAWGNSWRSLAQPL